NALSVGKCITKNSTPVNFEELYPPSVTDIQARLIEEAVCLGQGLCLEASTLSSTSEANKFLGQQNSELLKIPNVSLPEKFDGTRSKFDTFTINLQLQFRSDPQAFKSEESRIIYAGTYLTGNAYIWFKPHINSSTGEVSFVIYTSSIESLGAAFDDLDAYEREFDILKQDSSCAAFYAQIASIFSRLDWK
ncbi:hypothetical protein EPUL_004858, partial [Erysiphe pulchra]